MSVYRKAAAPMEDVKVAKPKKQKRLRFADAQERDLIAGVAFAVSATLALMLVVGTIYLGWRHSGAAAWGVVVAWALAIVGVCLWALNSKVDVDPDLVQVKKTVVAEAARLLDRKDADSLKISRQLREALELAANGGKR